MTCAGLRAISLELNLTPYFVFLLILILNCTVFVPQYLKTAQAVLVCFQLSFLFLDLSSQNCEVNFDIQETLDSQEKFFKLCLDILSTLI